MPSEQSIEQFNADLIALSHEHSQSAKWGEKVEQINQIRSYVIPATDKSRAERGSAEEVDDSDTNGGRKKTEAEEIFDTVASQNIELGSFPTVEGDIDDIPVIDARDSSPDLNQNIPLGGVVDEHVEVSEQTLSQINKILSVLPHQLKNRIDDILSNHDTPPEMIKQLVDTIIAGKNYNTINRLVGNIERSLESIQLAPTTTSPRVRQASSRGLARHPFVIAVIVLGLLVGGWRYIYRPVSATLLIRRGVEAIESEQNDRAQVIFLRAQRIYQHQNQYLRYARAFRALENHPSAVQYYQDMQQAYPTFKQGIIEFATYDGYELGNVERATDTLEQLIHAGITDEEIFILAGNMNIFWGDQKNSDRYEVARRYYASLIDRQGINVNILSLMARYFIRTNNQTEVLRIVDYFINSDPRTITRQADPKSLVELLGYLVDIQQYERATAINNYEAITTDIDPEYFYHAARYFLAEQNYFATDELLGNLALFFERNRPTTIPQQRIEILGYGLIADRHYQKRQYDDALNRYNQAIELYQSGLSDNTLTIAPEFGRLYFGRANVYYTAQQSLQAALESYLLAQQNLYNNEILQYSLGSIYYNRSQHNLALEQFNSIAVNNGDNSGTYDGGDSRSSSDNRGGSDSRARSNGLLALANTLYRLGGYHSAISHYNEAIDLLSIEREISGNYDNRNPEHRAIIEGLIVAHNNAGVAYAKIAERTSNRDQYLERSLGALTNAQTLLTNYQRVNAGTPASQLPFQNSFQALHQQTVEMAIYNALPQTLSSLDDTLISRSALTNPSDPRLSRTVSP